MAEKLRNIACLHCGGEVVISEDGKTATCKYCRKTYKIGSSLSDGATIDFALATEYWKTFRFADAKRKFLDVTKDDKDFAEAYWGAVVSEYGIEWGENRFGETVPTCHRAHAVSVFDDANYKKAVKLSGDEKYKDLANKIEEVRKEIIEKSSEEKDYDVFICFKATEQIDGRTRKTDDFELGREIYNELTENGYKVFFSPETLMKVKEQEFEPYIFKALSTARVMLLLCSDNEKIESPWVKNEWGRFLDMKNGSGLIPVCGNKYEPFSPAMLPNELRKLNAIEFGAKLFTQINSKLDAYFPEKVKERELAEKKKQEELAKEKYSREKEEQERRIKELEDLIKSKSFLDNGAVKNGGNDTSFSAFVAPFVKRGNKLIEDGKFGEAINEFGKATDYDETCWQAWLGRLLAKFKVKKPEDLKFVASDFDDTDDYKNLVKYCSDKSLLGLLDEINKTKKDRHARMQSFFNGSTEKKSDAVGNLASVKTAEETNSGDFVIDKDGILTKYVGKENEVVVPQNVKFIGRSAFKESNIKKITISEGVHTIMGDAFLDCSKLEEVVLPESMRSIGSSAFERCKSLKEIKFPDGLWNIRGFAFSGCSSLKELSIGKGVQSIGDFAFSMCENLQTVTIPASIITLGASVFSSCENIKTVNYYCSLDLIKKYFSGVTWIDKTKTVKTDKSENKEGTVGSERKIAPKKETNLSDFEIDGETLVKYTGKGSEVVLPEAITRIAGKAFSGCSSINAVTLPKNLKRIDSDAFEGCLGLRKVDFTGTIEKWCQITFMNYLSNPTYLSRNLYINGKQVKTVSLSKVSEIKANAFSNVESLTKISLPVGLKSIGGGAFNLCTGLQEIKFSDGLTEIGVNAFRDCSSLKTLNLPEGLNRIKTCAFSGCSSLISVDVPASVTDIDVYAFANCSPDLIITVHYKGLFKPKGFEKFWNGDAKVVRKK